MGFNQESRTVNAGKNAISALTNKTITLVLAFVSRKFSIQYIGVEYLGINGLFANILTILSLADLGLGKAMNVSLYRPIAENDTDKIAALLGYYKKIYCGIAAGVFVIGMGFLPFLPYLVNLESEIPHLDRWYFQDLDKCAKAYEAPFKKDHNARLSEADGSDRGSAAGPWIARRVLAEWLEIAEAVKGEELC